MKTLTLEAFKSLVAQPNWQRAYRHEDIEEIVREIDKWDEESESLYPIEISHLTGVASVTSTLDDISITYSESFNYDECDPDSLTTSTDEISEPWSIEGVLVTDEDGNELDSEELAEYLPEDFSNIDYADLDIDQVVDVDLDEKVGAEHFELQVDNAPNFRFSGDLLATAASSVNPAAGSEYSGSADRWTELTLYKTQSGKFVCHKINRTLQEDERDEYSGRICETLDEVREFFGEHWLAKQLLENAQIS